MFRLSRYFSLAALAGMVVIIGGLTYYISKYGENALIEQQTEASRDVGYVLSSTLREQLQITLQQTRNVPTGALAKHPSIVRLNQSIKPILAQTRVVKVKLYNLDGLTVFSTDERQIGSDKSSNTGFLRARSGEPASEIVFRDEFYSFEKVIFDRDLIATYLPAELNGDDQVDAVFELYADVTPLVETLKGNQSAVLSGVTIAMLALYVFLFLIVRRADRIILWQYEEQRDIENRLRQQAFTDSLTGLANRESFNMKLDEAIFRSRRQKKTGALLFIDLDRFKLINDSLGHDAGDELLRAIAMRIKNAVRDVDAVFRLSGDEFVVILEDMGKPELAASIAERIVEAMRPPVLLYESDAVVSASIGITVFDGKMDDKSAEDIVREADTAMYQAKESSELKYVFFDGKINDNARERLEIEHDLKKAISDNEFFMVYQPKFDAKTRKISSVESLLRWNHPERGVLLPSEFIGILEETGLIGIVGAWVIDETCRQTSKWIEEGYDNVRVSLNISAKQFRSSTLVQRVRDSLERYRLPAGVIELELTESMFINDTGQAIVTMNELKKIGVVLSVDDFGSGYSSMNYLKDFPLDYLKIDRSFVHDMHDNSKDASIVRAITALGKSLNLKVIAEGVEKTAQADILAMYGCDELQGYYFAYPGHPDEINKLYEEKTNVISSKEQ